MTSFDYNLELRTIRSGDAPMAPGISRRGSAGAFALELHWKTCHTNFSLI